MEVYAGPALDLTALGLQCDIPRCRDGTRLVYRISSFETESSPHAISSEPEPLPSTTSRVVHFTFHGAPDAYMMLGQIEVMGAVAPPPSWAPPTDQNQDFPLSKEAQVARDKYHGIICGRRGAPGSLIEALELEVLRLEGCVLPQQRDALLRKTPEAGPWEAYDITGFLSVAERRAHDAAKSKGGWGSKSKGGWGWNEMNKMMGGSGSKEPSAAQERLEPIITIYGRITLDSTPFICSGETRGTGGGQGARAL